MPATSSLGAFNFLKLAGNPVGSTKTLELVTRPGIDGQEIWDNGARGVPFQMRSFVDQSTHGLAQELMAEYRAAVSSTVSLSWEGRTFGNVTILGVRQVNAKKLGGSSGGISELGGALLVADWLLVIA